MNRRPRPTSRSASLLVLLGLAACSPGIGNNLPTRTTGSAGAGSSNLPVGLDLGLVPTSPAAEPAIAGVRIPAIGTTAAREVVFLGFSTAALSNDGDGAGTLLSRDTTTDTNTAADVFVAAIAAQAVDHNAFSQSLAGKFRHPRCVTCHSMQANDTLAFVSSPQAHAGPLPGPMFPNNDPATCEACHVTSSTFPVVGWQAPAASFDIRNKTVAQLNTMAQNVPAGDLEHFVTDARVLWALDSGILPQVGGRNGIADDDHDGVLEPEDTDGVARTVPGGSVGFLRDIEEWRTGGMKVNNADAVSDITLVSRVTGGTAAGNAASTRPRLLWVANNAFDPDNAAATNPIGTLYVAFQSEASDLVAGDGNGAMDVFRAAVDLRAEEDATGATLVGGLNLVVQPSGTVLVSAQNGGTGEGNGASGLPVIGGANGELIAFESVATDLVAGFTDNNGAAGKDIYLRNVNGTTTALLSHSVGNQATGADGTAEKPAIASNGKAVAFETDATDMIATDSNGVRDVYHARTDGVAPFTRVRSSVSTAGNQGSGGASSAAVVHEDGSGRIRVAFQSDKTDLASVTATTNVFLFDSATGFSKLLNQVITPSSNDAPILGDGAARAPVIAGDGSVIAFESDSTNLDVLRADGNGVTDIFLVETSQIADDLVLPFRASINGSEGAEGNGASTEASLGTFVGSTTYGTGFTSYATAATNLGTSDSTNLMVSFLAETSGVIVDFSASATSGPAPLSVTFTDASSGNPTSWEWDFDNDGTVDSTQQNPTHVFTAGTYSVKLTARSAVSEGTKTSANLIRAIGPVVASFTATPTSGAGPLTVAFTDTSTEQPTSWAWDFENDGTVDSTVQNPTHTYTTLGTYTVSLTATNELGPNTTVQTNAISVVAPVVAEFSGTPLSGTIPLAVTFTDASTGDPTSWAWDFENDGTVDSTDQNPVFTYASPGNYTVKLTATGPGGTDSETKASYVAVSGPVVANFTSSSTTNYNNVAVTFSDTSTGTVTAWQWDFENDGTVDSTLQNPSFTFTTPGTYSVKLTASGPGGTDDELKVNYFVSVASSVPATLEPAKDTSIYSESTGNSNGQNTQIVCGNAATTGAVQQGRRRALVEFDVAGTVPAGATILTAELQLTNVFAPTNPIGTVTVSISRVTREWGEAGAPGSNGGIGGGTAAATGDATWANAIVGTSAWTSAGGDFVGASDTTPVAGLGTYSWTSATVTSNVQAWLDLPVNNHGWIIRGTEVSGTRTAKVFGSVQNATSGDRPKLVLTYRPSL